jgi:hypothetical protein
MLEKKLPVGRNSLRAHWNVEFVCVTVVGGECFAGLGPIYFGNGESNHSGHSVRGTK